MSKKVITPKELTIDDVAVFEAKLAEFAAVGAQGMHVVFDFDRTLTVKMPNRNDEVTTWHILREYLPDEAKLEYERLFEKYRPLEIKGELTQEGAVDWWSSALRLFVKHKTDLAAVEETFLERANIRPGTVELFRLCAERNIPTIILSAGVREVIDIWCRKYGIKPSLVISTSLKLNERNQMIGWQEDTLIHILNKSEFTHPELEVIRANRPKVILVGDSLYDATMVNGDRDVLRVRVLDPRDDEIVSPEEECKTFALFDALIKTGSLQPLAELIRGLG